jgi:hypothetical protein
MQMGALSHCTKQSARGHVEHKGVHWHQATTRHWNMTTTPVATSGGQQTPPNHTGYTYHRAARTHKTTKTTKTSKTSKTLKRKIQNTAALTRSADLSSSQVARNNQRLKTEVRTLLRGKTEDARQLCLCTAKQLKRGGLSPDEETYLRLRLEGAMMCGRLLMCNKTNAQKVLRANICRKFNV